MCSGDIGGNRTQLAETKPQTRRPGLIVLRVQRAAINRDGVRQAVNCRYLAKLRLIAVAVAAAVFPGSEGILQAAFTLHNRYRREWLNKGSLAAVGFFNRYLQIAAARCRVEIADGEGPRCDVALIDGVAVLLNSDLGIRLGNTADDRGKPAQAVRQHIVIRRQLRAAKLHAVEDIGRRIAVAERELPLQALDIPLKIRVHRIPVAAVILVVIPGGIVAQPPRAEVQPALQVGVVVIIRAVFTVAPGVAAAEVIVQQRGRYAFIPFGRIHPAARGGAHRRLRDTEV